MPTMTIISNVKEAAVEKNNSTYEKKVVLGLSGGVDSTAACLLLKKRGMDVTGLFFDVLGNGGELKSAQLAANKIGVPLIYRDVSENFKNAVIRNFCSEYAKGRTPNPCVICNPLIKFKVLIEEADRIGARYVATGHYARVINEGNKWYIGRSENQAKDQSYMLYRLKQDVISRLLLPLGRVNDKKKTRNIVSKIGIENAYTKDSQDICFTDSSAGYKQYLDEYADIKPYGEFISTSGELLGEHKGITNYTVGQRKGLGIAFGKPMFVVGIDAEKNQVILGENDELFNRTLYSVNNSFSYEIEDGKILAKIRYLAKPAEAEIFKYKNKIKVMFKEPQRAITPGQSVVFYDMEGIKVLGGGFIE